VEAPGRQVARAVAGFLLGAVLVLGVPAPVGVDAHPGLDRFLVAPPPDLLDGDVVFRRGVDAIGRIVLSQSEQSRFSHVGMVVRAGARTLVAHALPETSRQDGGVRLEALESFGSPAHAADIGYYRPRQMSEKQRAEVRQYLLASVGTPFDMRFEYSTDGSVYCTELVLKALARVGIDLTRSLDTVHVLMLEEPAFAPDSLWRADALQALESTER